MDPQATISHLLGVLCSQAESLRKRTRVDSICSCDFYIRNIPSVLRSWSSLVCILLRVELVGLFRLKFKGEALCLEPRKLHPVASKMVCPHPPPVFPSCFGKARGAGRICMQFPTQRAVLAHPGGHIFPECCFLSSLNNQGGVKS